MVIAIFVIVGFIIFGSAAVIQAVVSPTELHEMGIWIDHPQF